MSENQFQQLNENLEKTTEQLRDTQQVIKEMQILRCIDALILSGLFAVVIQTFSYLITGTIQTNLEATLYMFSLLIGPAAFFLLLLHLYELYGIMKRGEKSIPLTLDLMYFLYLAFAFVTMITLNSYYQQHNISQNILTPGWGVAVGLLCVEVPIVLLCAKYVVTMFFIKRLPHFFDHPQPERRERPLAFQRHVFKPRQVYYFRKKPDVSLWQNEEFFVRYK
jgi:hypothetical protein